MPGSQRIVPPLPNPGPDESRGPQLIVVYAVGFALATVFVALRFWSRKLIKAIGADDWCMLVAAVFNVPLTVVTIILAADGGTRHLFYLAKDPALAISTTRLNWIARPFGFVSLTVGKISVALLILRLLERTSRWRKWILHVANALTAINGILLTIVDFAQCENVHAIWNPALKAKTKCMDPDTRSSIALFTASWNTFIDFFLATMAVHLVWDIQLNIKKKIGVCIFLGCSILTGIASALKTSSIANVHDDSDLTWDSFWLYVWNCVETTLLIILGSVPTLRPLYSKLTGRENRSISNPYYPNSFSKSGISRTTRINQSYKFMDSDISHPLVDLKAPGETHKDTTQRVQ
ncbi:hypothetical protein DM02DRAFT_653560 [Periconia macrospinosa]|uniref:Rhodopsin domain-containing protein n=1 Tax=Periconia macrospinosa TaxID=97972 RepID=A0A2V1DYY0_9PLEO|nr:hypothetical protein DM02DRAFT_653560 [Periconia macrospinosa]